VKEYLVVEENMLVPKVCGVCGQIHNPSYQRYLKCVKKVPKGEIYYPDFYVSWENTSVFVKPNEKRWKQLRGLQGFSARAFSLMSGWKFIGGLIKLEEVISWFSGGSVVALVDFDVREQSNTYHVCGFDSFLRVKKGSLQWVEKYETGPFFVDRSTVSICRCDTCLPNRKFDIVLDGSQARVEVLFSVIFINFGFGTLTSRVESSQNHEDIFEVIRRSWRGFDKYCGFRVMTSSHFSPSGYVSKIRVKNDYFGDFYILDDGTCYFAEEGCVSNGL